MTAASYPVKRRYLRAPVLCFVTFWINGQEGELCATAISEGGCIVLGTKLAMLSQRIGLFIELPDGARIRTEGIVRDVVPEVGVGIEFTSISPGDKNRITNLIKAFMLSLSKDNLFPQKMVMDNPPSSRRANPRVQVSFEATLEDDVMFQRVRVRDASLRGVSVLVKKPYAVGQSVRFTGPRGRFAARTIVRNCIPMENMWRVGLEVVETLGNWIIS